jgi:hypothetical protein
MPSSIAQLHLPSPLFLSPTAPKTRRNRPRLPLPDEILCQLSRSTKTGSPEQCASFPFANWPRRCCASRPGGPLERRLPDLMLLINCRLRNVADDARPRLPNVTPIVFVNEWKLFSRGKKKIWIRPRRCRSIPVQSVRLLESLTAEQSPADDVYCVFIWTNRKLTSELFRVIGYVQG